MARIIGGIGTSHVPTIGVAYDKKKQADPSWAPLFEGYKPVAAWLAEQKPDVLVFFYNDHATTLFFDLYPTFALGVGERFPIADEGAGLRGLPDLRGDVDLQAHIAESLVNDEFDIAVFQSKCFRLGQAVRRAVESYPEDLKVVVVGTGGLSHQIHGERTGFNNTEWDLEFLDTFRDNPEPLTQLTHADYVKRGGAESVEQIMWLAMRGALTPTVREVHRNYYLATTTAMTVTVYETVEGAGE